MVLLQLITNDNEDILKELSQRRDHLIKNLKNEVKKSHPSSNRRWKQKVLEKNLWDRVLQEGGVFKQGVTIQAGAVPIWHATPYPADHSDLNNPASFVRTNWAISETSGKFGHDMALICWPPAPVGLGYEKCATAVEVLYEFPAPADDGLLVWQLQISSSIETLVFSGFNFASVDYSYVEIPDWADVPGPIYLLTGCKLGYLFGTGLVEEDLVIAGAFRVQRGKSSGLAILFRVTLLGFGAIVYEEGDILLQSPVSIPYAPGSIPYWISHV